MWHSIATWFRMLKKFTQSISIQLFPSLLFSWLLSLFYICCDILWHVTKNEQKFYLKKSRFIPHYFPHWSFPSLWMQLSTDSLCIVSIALLSLLQSQIVTQSLGLFTPPLPLHSLQSAWSLSFSDWQSLTKPRSLALIKERRKLAGGVEGEEKEGIHGLIAPLVQCKSGQTNERSDPIHTWESEPI